MKGTDMRVLQVAQKASDLDRATSFYTDLLGVPPAARFDPPGLLFFAVDGTRILFEANASSALLYYEVPSVRERVAELRGRGVEIESEPHVIFTHADDTLGPAGMAEWHAFIRDPEGNLVGLVSHEQEAE
jgi:methylmalonyl-CoA/ethylmalonyl-CoA epimerase